MKGGRTLSLLKVAKFGSLLGVKRILGIWTDHRNGKFKEGQPNSCIV